jgi:glycosyltransferase involved in cell wall biosynthesis
MDCSIVIRAFNEGQHLGRLLEGIRHQTLQDAEIILVDSGSTDETLSIAASYGVKIVHIKPEEFTFGRSLNMGVNAATHELVVIASAHVYPIYPDWLERLLEPFSDPAIALTYGKQRGRPFSGLSKKRPATKFSEHEIFARWFPQEANPRQNHPFCNNANAAVRRSLWVRHPYNEMLTGLEDLAWARWALTEGHLLAYIPAAEIIHVHSETPRGVYNRYRREAMAFKHIYPEAHFNLYDFFRMSAGNIFNDLWHATQQKKLLSSFASIFWFRCCQFWGTYKGYRQSLEWNWQLRQTFYYPRGIEADQSPTRDVEPIRYNK